MQKPPLRLAHRWIAAVIIAAALPACTSKVTRWTLDPVYRAPETRVGPVRQSETAARPEPGDRHYLFTSFRDVHPPTAHLLYSNDAVRWRTLNNDRPILAAEPGMRDPHIAQGPDGRFHMVWTNGDFGPYIPAIGYANSDDLVEWSEPRELPVMASVPGVTHCWAPELFWLEAEQQWLIHWSSTVAGYAPPETAGGEPVGNHRIWATTTRDFETFAEPFVLFDPGYIVIDATMLPVRSAFGTTYYLIYKDERLDPRMKAMRLATGPTPRGPWSEPSATFTRPWTEAPSALRVGQSWYVYFDAYSKGFYGAVRSSDLVNWRDVTDQVSFPPGHRHGSVFEITGETARRLLVRRG
ncbi:MAG: glycoside hydrolase family 43 protein [Planctomycetota bacterium]